MEIIRENKQELVKIVENKSTFVGTPHEGAEIHTVKLVIGKMTIEVSVHNTSPNEGDIRVHHLGDNELTVFSKVSKKQVRSAGSLWTDINTKE